MEAETAPAPAAADAAVYMELDASVSERGPLAQTIRAALSSSGQPTADAVEGFVLSALQSVTGQPRDDCVRVANERLRNKALLLDDPSAPGRKRRRAEAQAKSARAPPPPPAAIRRRAGLIVPAGKAAGAMTHAALAPLRALWQAYACDLVRSATSLAEAQARVAHADLHGAVLRVVRARCPALVGAEGTCVQETAQVFKLVTAADVVRNVQKAGTVFATDVGGAAVTLYGSNLCQRPADRASKRTRSARSVYLP